MKLTLESRRRIQNWRRHTQADDYHGDTEEEERAEEGTEEEAAGGTPKDSRNKQRGRKTERYYGKEIK